MTRSNRILNRLLILLVGLVAIATGLALELLRFSPQLSLATPKLAAPRTEILWIGLGVCVIIIVLALLWIATRGRGRSSDLITLSGGHGSIVVGTRVAADLVAQALDDNRDIVSVGTGSYQVRGEQVLSIRVVARKGADLPLLISSASRTIDELDQALERRIPVLLQIVSGLSVREVRTR